MKTLLLIVTLSALGFAQESTGTPEAKAKAAEAKAARKTDEFAKAASLFAEAVELDPSFYDAHTEYIGMERQVETRKVPAELAAEERSKAIKAARDVADKRLFAQYEKWAQKYPSNPVVQFMIGDLYEYKDWSKTEIYSKKAAEMDPKYARAYFTMGLVEEVRGDKKKYLELLAKAAEVAPDDPSWNFYYANALRDSNPELYRKKASEVAQRFPDSERGAQALYWLSFDSQRREDQVEYAEQLRRAFSPAKFSWSSSGMSHLFDIYSRTNTKKALDLAEEMARVLPDTNTERKAWQTNVSYTKALIDARALIDEKKPAEALKQLEGALLPRYIDLTPLHVLKAEAAAASGDTGKAYDGLLKLMGDKPTDALQSAMIGYGAKLGKTQAQVMGEVRASLEAKSTPSTDFSLPRYPDMKNLSIADYRGKVVLLNFWYPFCGPCRGEFPSLQNILNKYGPDKFVILSLNVHPEEDEFVMPYMKGMNWGFIPIRSDEDFALKAYKARGFPSNFLLDQDGKVIYKPGVIRGGDAQRTMELQIEALLAGGASK